MVTFYKMNPTKWDTRTAMLSLEQEAAYLRLCNAMYIHEDGVPNIDRVLAGLFRCSPRKARRLVNDLVDLGKVWIEDDRIYNERAVEELENVAKLRRTRRETGKLGGLASGKSRSPTDKPLKNNNQDEASASSKTNQTRLDKSREESPHSPPKGGDELPLESQNGKRQSTPRGTYLPEDWEPPEKELLWAKGEYGLTDAQLNKITAEFRDYWCGEAGQRARKRDWSKTWRNRVRQVAPRLAKDEIPKPRRNGTGWVVMHGCEQYWPWRDRYRQENNPKMYEFKDTPGTEVHVPTLWPGGRI